MECTACKKQLVEGAKVCPDCAKTVSTILPPGDFDRKTAAAIAWALIAVGVLGFGFVVANSWTDWFSGLDFVAPTMILVIGIASLSWAKKRK